MPFLSELKNISIPLWVLILLGFIISFVITYYAIPPLVRIAKIKKLFDLPNGRTSHNSPVPNLGGVAIFAGVSIAYLLLSDFTALRDLKHILAGLIVIFFIGLKDDFYPLVPIKKFLGQLLATFILVVPGNLRITDFHGLFGVGEVGYIISLTVTFLIIITLINSFNLIDGIDGLAAGTGIVCSLSFSIWFFVNREFTSAVLGFSLAGSLAAFFGYNVFGKKNKIFLGDSGAMITGFLVAVLALRFVEMNNEPSVVYMFDSVPAMAMYVLIIPLFDTLRVVFLRIIRGNSPFRPDTNHIHHRILMMADSHLKATLIIMSVNVTYIIAGILLQGIGNELMILLGICTGVLITLSTDLFFSRHHNK